MENVDTATAKAQFNDGSIEIDENNIKIKKIVDHDNGKVYVHQTDGNDVEVIKFDNVQDNNANLVNESYLLQNPIDYNIIENSVLINSTQSACLKITSTTISGFGFYLKKEPTKGGVLSNLINQPNNEIDESMQDIINNLTLDYQKWKDMYIGIKQLTSGKIIMKYIPAQSIRIVPTLKPLSTSKRIKKYYEIHNNDWGQAGNYDPISSRVYRPLRWDTKIQPNVWYIARWYKKSPNNLFFAEPDYLSSLYPISENKKIFDYNNVFFDNNARPDYILVVKGIESMSTTQKEAVQSFLQTEFKGKNADSGKYNAHKTLYLQFDEADVEVEFIPISGKSADDASFRLLRMDNRDDIARAWNVPPKVIGIASSGSLGSGSEAIGALKLLKEYMKTDQITIENFLSKVFEKLTGFNPELKLRKIELTNEKDKAVIFNLLASLRDQDGNPILPKKNVEDDLELETNDKTKDFVVTKNNNNIETNEQGKPVGDSSTDEEDKRHAGETDTEYL